jgi:hypothetical protein
MRSLVAIVADTSLSDDLDLHQYCSPLMKGDHLTYKLDAEFKLCGIAELFLERPHQAYAPRAGAGIVLRPPSSQRPDSTLAAHFV